MQWLRNFFSRLFGRKNATDWDSLDYANKPSTAGDDFRKNNEV
jgi:hypothetical protein